MKALINELSNKIKTRKAQIGIIGMGYVGIPLGLEFVKSGFSVTGFDKNKKRVDDLNDGKQIMKHISSDLMTEFISEDKGKATADFTKIKNMDCLIICVPTPLDEHEQPDMTYVESAANEISKNLSKYIVEKGFVCVDGASLTVVNCDENTFTIALIPYTRDNTVLGTKGVGNSVNIETDIIGKYIEKLSIGNQPSIDLD